MTEEQAKEIIREIIGNDSYEENKGILPDWIKKILKWIFEKIEDIYEWILEKIIDLLSGLNIDLSGSSGNGINLIQIISAIIVVVLGAALIAALTFVILKLMKHSNVRRKTEISEAEELVALSEIPDEAYRLYEEFLTKGEYRLAYRYLFLSLLIEFNKRELIRIRLYKTNRMYRREMLDSGVCSEDEITPFFELFNRVWFGGRRIDADKLEQMHSLYKSVLSSVDEKKANKKAKEAGKRGEEE